MKNLSIILLGVLTVVFLVLGNMYWQDRTDIKAEKAGVKAVNDTESVQEDNSEPDDASSLEKLTSNWPENARNQFLQAGKSNETYKVAIVGSPSLGAETGGWSVQLQKELNDEYGDVIDVELFEFDTTSTEFFNSTMSEEVTGYQPDLVLFEPFTLNDNTAGVSPEDTEYSVNAFLEDLKSANADVTLILQPGHPLYGAVFYPQQVDELKAFAEENSYLYLDHWTEWPEIDDEALQELVAESKDAPSQKGHELWAGYLKDYFIAE